MIGFTYLHINKQKQKQTQKNQTQTARHSCSHSAAARRLSDTEQQAVTVYTTTVARKALPLAPSSINRAVGFPIHGATPGTGGGGGVVLRPLAALANPFATDNKMVKAHKYISISIEDPAAAYEFCFDRFHGCSLSPKRVRTCRPRVYSQ